MKKMSLNTKMILIVCELSVSCFAIAGFGLYGMSSIEHNVTNLVNVVNTRKDLWSKLSRIELNLSLKEREFYTQKDADKQKQIGVDIDDLKKKLDGTVEKLEVAASDNSKEKLGDFKKNVSDWWTGHQVVRTLGSKGDVDGAREAFNKTKDAREKLLEISVERTEATEAKMLEEAASLSASSESTKTTMLIVALFAVCAGAGLGWLLLQQVRRGIDAIVSNLVENSERVGATAGEFAESATKLSQATTEQAASLQQTAASTQELTSIVQRNMENAQRANAVTLTSQTSAERGQGVVEEMKVAISEIDASNQDIMHQVNESNTKISEITKVISEIGDKTKVINDIVFQTKLLSFNASVEAARAGEHGKGFAVVAEEVGNLARMSGAAAKEISEMLDVSISKVEAIVQDTRTNVERLVAISKTKVEAGTRITFSCSDVLTEIVRNISEVTRMSTDIASASQEQAQGVQEISRAMTQLDSVTQMNASAAAQASTSAEDLSGQADSLQKTISDLTELVHGEGSHSVAASPAPRAKSTKTAAHAPLSTKLPKKPTHKPPSSFTTAAKNVVPMANSKTAAKPSSGAPAPKVAGGPLKLAAGSDVSIPTEDDPRFKDV